MSDRKRSAASPHTVAKLPRNYDWGGFAQNLRELLGSDADLVQATTKAHAQHVQEHVQDALAANELTSLAGQSWWTDPCQSVTACGRKTEVARAVVGALLSTQTDIEASSAAQARLWAEFPGGPTELRDALGIDADAPDDSALKRMKQCIHCVGKIDPAQGKSTPYKQRRPYWIHKALLTSWLEDLQSTIGLSDEQALNQLSALHQMGPKTAACVLSFSCGRPLLAVDSNIAHAAKALGWYTGKADPKSAASNLIQPALNGLKETSDVKVVVPPELRAEMHCLLLPFGQLVNAYKDGSKDVNSRKAAERMQQAAGVDAAEHKAAFRAFVTRWKA